MTHNDIYIKFMIEYDKANVTSSYPSLTEYEVATVLDKAYNALISQKITGNNFRRSTFESDIKSISDLNPLVKRETLKLDGKSNNIFYKNTDGAITSMPDNMRSTGIPEDMLYFITGAIPVDMHTFSGWMNDVEFNSNNTINPMDISDSNTELKQIRLDPVKLVNHSVAERFYSTSYNMPWVKNPVCFLEDGRIYLLCDPVVGIPSLQYFNNNTNQNEIGEWMSVTYISKPNLFVKDLDNIIDNVKNTYQPAVEQTGGIDPQPNTDVFLNIEIDRYNLEEADSTIEFSADNQNNIVSGRKRIHIKDIYFASMLQLNLLSDYQSFPDTAKYIEDNKASTYYIICDDAEYNPRAIKVTDMADLSLTIGQNTSECADSVQSMYLSNGERLIVCNYVPERQVGGLFFLPQASELYVITYADLYNSLVSSGVISGQNDSWSSDILYDAGAYITRDDGNPVKITSSIIYNSDNTTDTEGVKNIYSYQFEIWGDDQCTTRAGQSGRNIYLQINNTNDDPVEVGLFPEDGYGNSQTGKLERSIDTESATTTVTFTYTVGAAVFIGSCTASSSSNVSTTIAANQVITLVNQTVSVNLEGKAFSFGNAVGSNGVAPADVYSNAEYDYVDIFKKYLSCQQQQITSEEVADSINLSYFYFKPTSNIITREQTNNVEVGNKTLSELYTFELDDVMAGELISLAVSYALENVESPRLNNHLQMRGLEA